MHFGETLRRDQHPLALPEHADALEVPDGEAVRVGGNQAEPAGVRREQHTGEDRPEVVLGSGPDDLAEREREGRRVEPHALTVVRREARVVLGGLEPQRRAEAAGGDDGLVAGDDDRHGAGLEPANDLTDQLRDDGDAAFLNVGGDLDPVGDLKVGANELEPVVGRGDAQVLENGQGAGSARNRALRGRDRLGKGVAFAAELHLGLLGSSVAVPERYEIFGSRSSRACGLWTEARCGRSPAVLILTGLSTASTGAGAGRPAGSGLSPERCWVSPSIHSIIHWLRA